MRRRKGNKRRVGVRKRAGTLASGVTQSVKSVLPVVMMVLTAIAIPGLSYLAYQQVVGSSHFAVESVNVTGLEHIEPNAFREQIGFVSGMNYFDLDPKRVTQLAAELEWVDAITVDRRLPNTVSITVNEKEPIGVSREAGRFVFYDRQGELIADVSTRADWERADALPWISGVDLDADTRIKARALANEISDRKIGGLSELSFDPHLGFVALIEPGFEIRLGRDQFGERLDKVVEILKHESPDNLKYILVDQSKVGRRVTVGHKTTTVAKLGQGR